MHKLGWDYWHSQILTNIASTIRVLLKFNGSTIVGDFGHYARVLIDVDLSKLPPDSLLLKHDDVRFFMSILNMKTSLLFVQFVPLSIMLPPTVDLLNQTNRRTLFIPFLGVVLNPNKLINLSWTLIQKVITILPRTSSKSMNLISKPIRMKLMFKKAKIKKRLRRTFKFLILKMIREAPSCLMYQRIMY